MLADAALVQHDAEFRLDAVLQVTATPAHHAFPNRVGTGLDPSRKRGQLLRCQPPGPVRNGPVHQPRDALGIVAVPIRRGSCPPDSFLTLLTPQRLAVHPAGLRRRCAVN